MSNPQTQRKRGARTTQNPWDESGKQKIRAKLALIKMEKSGHIIKQGLMRYVENCNRHIHTTVRGLAEEFGIEVEQLMPENLEESFLRMGEDLEQLLGPHAPVERPGKDHVEVDASQPMEYTELTGRYDPEILDDIVIFAYYLGHRLLDMTEETFTISDEGFKTDYRIWHTRLENLE